MVSEVGKAIDNITGVYIAKPIKTTYLKEYDKKHNGAVMFDRAVYSYVAERDPNTGLINTGLTKEEAEELEKEMHFKAGSLSPYNMRLPEKNSGDFSWATFSIKIPKEGLVINTSNSAKEKLLFKVLSVGSRVANSTLELAVNPVKYDILLTSTEKEAILSKDKATVKKKAFALFSAMSLNDMIDFLSIYNDGRHGISKDSTPDFIEAEVAKIVDSEPTKFIETMESPYFDSMIFLNKCIKANLVYKQGPKYIISEGGDILGETYSKALENLQSEDYQSVKIGLISKLEARK